MKLTKRLLGIFLFVTVTLGFSVRTSQFFSCEKKSAYLNTVTYNSAYTGLSAGTPIQNSGYLLSWSFSSVYAQSSLTEKEVEDIAYRKYQELTKKDFRYYLNELLKVLYLIIWPLLFIAGLAVDNTLVYGQAFHFDKILWQIWMLMRDIANFSLFFVALYQILKYLYQKKGKEIQGIIKKMLIAGILIQASRFLMGAVIDISSIVTYSVGALPSLGSDESPGGSEKVMNVPIIKPNVFKYSVGPDDKTVSFVYYSYGSKNIPECIHYVHTDYTAYIVGKKKFIPSKLNKLNVVFDLTGVCSDGKEVYRFKEHTQLSKATDAITYDSDLDKMIHDNAIISGAIIEGVSFVPRGFSDKDCGKGKCGIISHNDKFFTDEKDKGGVTIESILASAKGYARSFITLYTSLLDHADLSASSDMSSTTDAGMFGDFLKKTVFSILLFIPLVTMTIVLILRVGILWLAIIFMPLLIIKRVFFDKDSKIGGEWFNKHFEKTNLLSIIFAPVIMVFALSLSIIFMTSINQDMGQHIRNSSAFEGVGLNPQCQGDTTSEECKCPGGNIDILGLVAICDKSNTLNGAKDLFADTIQNMFALGIMWFLLFAAIKTNSIGESIGKAVQSVSQKALKTIPVIPMAGGGIGYGTFKDRVLSGGAINDVLSKVESQDREKTKQWNESLFGAPSTQFSGLKSNLQGEVLHSYYTGGAGAVDRLYSEKSEEFKKSQFYSSSYLKKQLEQHIEKNSSSIETKDLLEKIRKKYPDTNDYEKALKDVEFVQALHKANLLDLRKLGAAISVHEDEFKKKKEEEKKKKEEGKKKNEKKKDE